MSHIQDQIDEVVASIKAAVREALEGGAVQSGYPHQAVGAVHRAIDAAVAGRPAVEPDLRIGGPTPESTGSIEQPVSVIPEAVVEPGPVSIESTGTLDSPVSVAPDEPLGETPDEPAGKPVEPLEPVAPVDAAATPVEPEPQPVDAEGNLIPAPKGWTPERRAAQAARMAEVAKAKKA